MKQVYRKGLSHIVVAEAPEPMVISHHVLVNPVYSLISSGTESASIHEGIIKEVAENPSQLRKVWDGLKAMGPLATITEVRAKFEGVGWKAVVVFLPEFVEKLTIHLFPK